MTISTTNAKQGVCAATGFQVSALYAGIRSAQKDDLMLLLSDQPASVAGVFTSNQVQAWCVQHNRERIKAGLADGVLVNAGCANCCNGLAGKAADRALAEGLAPLLGSKRLLTASTGVIGRPLAISRITPLLPQLVGELGTSPAHALRAASAIMTTDTKPKLFAVEQTIQGHSFRVGGMAKGSGMIAPNMATMLSFLTCDAAVPAAALQAALTQVANRSFNCVSVDGDTSTNDMLLYR
jgi:glutamate N-acetyltransferase/amino-acid N-acetyltransferase